MKNDIHKVAPFKVTKQQKAFLVAMSKEGGQTISAYMREMIMREMKREKWSNN